jgi:hypothetical protein
MGERHFVDNMVVVSECSNVVLRDVSWFVGGLASRAGYKCLLRLPGGPGMFYSSSMSLILASARMVFPFLDVEMTGSFWNGLSFFGCRNDRKFLEQATCLFQTG